MKRVSLPPMPTDQGVCRWCAFEMRQTLATRPASCVRGCEPANSPIYPGRCDDCRKEFETGDPRETHQCWICRKKEHGEYVAQAEAEGNRLGGYTRDRILTNMMNRRAS